MCVGAQFPFLKKLTSSAFINTMLVDIESSFVQTRVKMSCLGYFKHVVVRALFLEAKICSETFFAKRFIIKGRTLEASYEINRMSVSDCTKGSCQALDRYDPPLQCNFAQVLGRKTYIKKSKFCANHRKYH